MALKDYSSTPSANTAISGINIGEGCNASNINDAIRQLMADLAAAVPTRTILTIASVSPYTPPAGVRQLRVKMWGGGAGGAGFGGSGSFGVGGGDTSFNSIVAKGAASNTPGGVGGPGGTGGTGTATGIIRAPGFSGTPGMNANTTVIVSNYGGTGGGAGGGSSGTAAVGYHGAGGGGAGISSPGSMQASGPGGGSGEMVEFIINSPAASYTFSVGAGGAAGTGAGAGAPGHIEVEEIY
jgi:hypothetical protein